jgi:hypothetical protein
VLITTNRAELGAGTAVAWSIRPDRVVVVAAEEPESESESANRYGAGSHELVGTLVDVADVGVAVDLFVALAPHLELQARTTEEVELRVGDRCRVVLAPDDISLWPVLDGPMHESDLNVAAT